MLLTTRSLPYSYAQPDLNSASLAFRQFFSTLILWVRLVWSGDELPRTWADSMRQPPGLLAAEHHGPALDRALHDAERSDFGVVDPSYGLLIAWL
jgi:hypothetical protein